MGNIVTPDQGLLPLPTYGSGVITPYPWWLNTALAIWALLALLCCWLFLLLFLLRYCCRWWRHRNYAADRKSLRERFSGSSYAQDRNNLYVANDQYFATASLPPVSPYVVQAGSDANFRDIHERRIVEDEFYVDTTPYVTATVPGTENEVFESGSEFISEEEIQNHKTNAFSRRPVMVISDESSEGVKKDIETNVQRNITKNYYINEEQNYFIQNDPSLRETSNHLHDQEIQRLPGPTVTTVNMAAERIAENPNWENASVKENFNNQNQTKAAAEIVNNDPALFKQNVKYEKQPNIYTHRPVIPEILRIPNRKLGGKTPLTTDEGSTTSEMSGHDSESVYETIRVFTPRPQPLPTLEDEDEYKTAGVDEVEIEIKDLVRIQKANEKSSNIYESILPSPSSARNSLIVSANSQQDQANNISGAEEREETVTETVKTQQMQTTVRQIGQNIEENTFCISSAPSIVYQGGKYI
ncbi:unnamed protein product [Rotaria magnacalcarata]|uniref:Uncharacterized protein n=3 Tax=Rotaria magnacalcarata TaxID=392030 RepID=A0A814H3K6_9BILA|nr:unnamed protein product [Rotaria magnacalcarata]CAF1660411.1 unnamed protein product [Rotaria magnacalcarata]CAF2030402.1 unnamed protein product [Rotaria magnacalcarata]CAF3842489.1 unnamed protein product [Rotaria magnacalcarata]CAF3948525.1 unnamed protein product [Rotaria magnacalcarata]